MTQSGRKLLLMTQRHGFGQIRIFVSQFGHNAWPACHTPAESGP